MNTVLGFIRDDPAIAELLTRVVHLSGVDADLSGLMGDPRQLSLDNRLHRRRTLDADAPMAVTIVRALSQLVVIQLLSTEVR